MPRIANIHGICLTMASYINLLNAILIVLCSMHVCMYYVGESGDAFEGLSPGVHSISIQFIQAGSMQALSCLQRNFTISSTSKLYGQ